MIPETKIMLVHREPRCAGSPVAEESHSWWELVYYISCEGTLMMDGETYEIKPGRFTLCRPHTPHSEMHTVNSVVLFCIFQCGIEHENLVLDDDSEHTVLRLCEAMVTENRRSGTFSGELQELILREILLRALRWQADRIGRRRDIEWAAEVIDQNFREPLRLHSLAADIGYGYDYFHHRFRERFGCSPKQYQIKRRVSYAKELLESGRYTCTEVAYLAGFSDSAQFSRIFKTYTGVSPANWRQSVEK